MLGEKGAARSSESALPLHHKDLQLEERVCRAQRKVSRRSNQKKKSLFLLANIREHSLQDAIQDKDVALLTSHPRGPCHHWSPAVGTRLVGDKGLNEPLTQLSLRRGSGQRSLTPACDPVVQAGNGSSGTACEIHHHLLSFISERLMPRCTQPGLVGSVATEAKVLFFLSESWSAGGHRQTDFPIQCDGVTRTRQGEGQEAVLKLWL